mgnify:CR=1
MNYSKSKKHEPTIKQFWLKKKERLQHQLNHRKIF